VGPDSAKIRDYLETKIVKFVGISGIFTIDAKDHTGIGKESLVMVQIKDGKWVYVDPKDYAKAP
jgi:branched-chain amino acid transport system substrate-binding protein